MTVASRWSAERIARREKPTYPSRSAPDERPEREWRECARLHTGAFRPCLDRAVAHSRREPAHGVQPSVGVGELQPFTHQLRHQLDQRVAALLVEHPHPSHVACQMPLGDEIGDDKLFHPGE
jgi:hypothetical protein